jgi:RNA polymerase sigma-70 factor (ECF subfamily)
VEAAEQAIWWEPAISDERRLVEQARHDSVAVAQLYRLHYPAIHAYLVRRVGDSHEAEDLTAEVFLTMVRTMWRFRWQGAPFRSWLYRIATRQANRWTAKRRRLVAGQLEDILSAPTKPRPDDDARDGELLRLALMTLSKPFQAALSLHYLEEMSVQEVAVVLRCSPGTVKSRLSRGRAMLRDYFSKRG